MAFAAHRGGERGGGRSGCEREQWSGERLQGDKIEWREAGEEPETEPQSKQRHRAQTSSTVAKHKTTRRGGKELEIKESNLMHIEVSRSSSKDHLICLRCLSNFGLVQRAKKIASTSDSRGFTGLFQLYIWSSLARAASSILRPHRSSVSNRSHFFRRFSRALAASCVGLECWNVLSSIGAAVLTGSSTTVPRRVVVLCSSILFPSVPFDSPWHLLASACLSFRRSWFSRW